MVVFFLLTGKVAGVDYSFFESLSKKELARPLARKVPVKPERVQVPRVDYQREFQEKLRLVREAFSALPKLPRGKIYEASIEEFYFLPFRCHFLFWKMAAPESRIFIILKGEVGLEDLAKTPALRRIPLNELSANIKEEVQKKGLKGPYLLVHPVFVASSALLRIENSLLLLSVKTAPVILSNGKLLIKDSIVGVFDPETGDWAEHSPVSHREADLYGVHHHRPYLLVVGKGEFLARGSYFRGLGYRGLFGSFGLGAKAWFREAFARDPVLFLLNRGRPRAILYTNQVEDCFMGFYGFGLARSLIVKNFFFRNWKYGVNIHDWSQVYVGGNTVVGTHLAHGIILSRYCSGTIYGNLSLRNGGAGVMLDRLSMGRIASNLLSGNKLGGVSIIENQGAIVEKNLILRNQNYGILVRNSQKVLIRENQIIHNFGPGIKIITADISSHLYRELYLDPYREISWAWVEGNYFRENIGGDLKTLRGGAVALKNNRFFPQMLNLAGEARNYNHLLFKRDLLIIPGYGDPTWHEEPPVLEALFRTTDLLVQRLIGVEHPEGRTLQGLLLSLPPKVIYSGLPRKVEEGKVEPVCARKWFLSAALQGEPKAMALLGALELKYHLAPSETALKWLALAALYGEGSGAFLLRWGPRWWGNSEKEGFRALREVLSTVDCSGKELPPWPELLGSCRPLGPWAKRLRSSLRQVLHESGFCEGKEVRYQKVWEYLKRESLKEAHRKFGLIISSVKEQIQERNRKKLAYYQMLDRLSEELKRALAEGDPEIRSLWAKEKTRKSWQEYFSKKTLGEDLRLMREFLQKIPAEETLRLEEWVR